MNRILVMAALALVLAAGSACADDLQAMRALVDQAASAAGIPARLAHAVIAQESYYDPALRGRAGEWGIGQIKCGTARAVGLRGACSQLADAATNLKFSFAYLRQALDRGGAGCAGVSLYQHGIFGRPGCTRYGREVMARAGN
jgi:soluble lytic murein transglycosylase-like protein